MSVYNVLEDWQNYIIQQFKNQPNLTVLIKALSEQLQEISQVFEDLQTLRTLDTAVGEQLDKIGQIVVLSREQAANYYNGTITEKIMGDDYYRIFLKYKIMLNNSRSTYDDIVTAFKMLYNVDQVFFVENPANPATLFLTIGGNFTPIMMDLMVNSKLTPKAAGVKVNLQYYNMNFFGFGDCNRFAQGFGKAPFAHSLPSNCYY